LRGPVQLSLVTANHVEPPDGLGYPLFESLHEFRNQSSCNCKADYRSTFGVCHAFLHEPVQNCRRLTGYPQSSAKFPPIGGVSWRTRRGCADAALRSVRGGVRLAVAG